jgi:hypothetical protein
MPEAEAPDFSLVDDWEDEVEGAVEVEGEAAFWSVELLEGAALWELLEAAGAELEGAALEAGLVL